MTRRRTGFVAVHQPASACSVDRWGAGWQKAAMTVATAQHVRSCGLTSGGLARTCWHTSSCFPHSASAASGIPPSQSCNPRRCSASRDDSVEAVPSCHTECSGIIHLCWLALWDLPSRSLANTSCRIVAGARCRKATQPFVACAQVAKPPLCASELLAQQMDAH